MIIMIGHYLQIFLLYFLCLSSNSFPQHIVFKWSSLSFKIEDQDHTYIYNYNLCRLIFAFVGNIQEEKPLWSVWCQAFLGINLCYILSMQFWFVTHLHTCSYFLTFAILSEIYFLFLCHDFVPNSSDETWTYLCVEINLLHRIKNVPLFFIVIFRFSVPYKKITWWNAWFLQSLEAFCKFIYVKQ